MKVFISHSSYDDAAVRALVEDLTRAHQQVWVDQTLSGGDAWWAQILEEIRACTIFVLALSDHSLRSKPCRAELDYAEALGLPILPVQIGQVSTYRTHPIFARQLVDYREPTRRSGIALISALHEQGLGRAELPHPLPEPPAIPYGYLLRLGAAIRGAAVLSPAVQAAAVFELREALDNEDEASVCADIRDLLRALLARQEVTYAIGREINKILGELPGPAPDDRADPTVMLDASSHDEPASAAGPYLHAASGRRYPLHTMATRIGRSSDNDIVLDDAKISRHHAVIIRTGGNYVINDLRSANGVHVQHRRISSSATLNDGDHVRIGNHEFTFHGATA